MNYREKQKKNPAEKKPRKLEQYIKKYPKAADERILGILSWEREADRQIEAFRENSFLFPRPGEELYMTGWAGAAGTLYLADRKKEELLTRFPEAFVRTAGDREVFTNFFGDSISEELFLPGRYLDDSDEGVSWIAPVGEGGLFKTFYRFGKETGLGFRVHAKEVPVRQITIEFCEFFLLHPWELLTGRSFLFSADHQAPILESLEAQGIFFKKIGTVTKDRQKLISRGEEESNINRPEPDALLTLLLEDRHL